MATLFEAYTAKQFEALFDNLDKATVDDLYINFGERTPIDNFPHYIKKNERLYFTQYNKLLRDESVEYDAMVTDYIERLSKTKTTGNSKDGGGDSTTRTAGQTHETTNSGADTTTDTWGRTDSLKKSGSEKTTDQGHDNLTYTGSEDTQRTGSETTTYEGTETHSQDTQSTTNQFLKRGDGIVEIQGVKSTHSIKGSYSDKTDNAEVSKTNPMSVSYSSTIGADATQNGLDFPNTSGTWDTADSQTQSHNGTTRSYSGYSETTEDDPNTTTETGDTDKLTYEGRSDTLDYGDNRHDKLTYEGRSDNRETGNESTLTYNDREDFNKAGGTDTHRNEKGTSQKTVNTGSDTDETKYGKTNVTNGTSRTTDRETGRHGYSPAELLDKSRTYILGTNAFRWLVSNFDKCFEWEVDI